MATNPVLYAIKNLTSGRSSGVFRGVRAAPELSDVGQQRNTLITEYNKAVEPALAGIEERKTVYDALVKQLEGSVSAKKTSYETLIPTLKAKATEAGAAYAANTASLRAQATDLQTRIGKANYDVQRYRQLIQGLPAGAGIGGNVNHMLYVSYTGALNRALGDQKTLPPQFEALNATGKQYHTDYTNIVNQTNAEAKGSYDAYLAEVEAAKTKQAAGYETYAGEATRITNKLKSDQAGIESLGYLATKGPSDSASPPVSTGETLAATDLYSGDLNQQMLGKKAAQQAGPEEDIVSGLMQSSLYSR